MSLKVGIAEGAVMYLHCPECVSENHLTQFEIGVAHDGGSLIIVCLNHQTEIGRFGLKEPLHLTCSCGENHGTSPTGQGPPYTH